MRSGLGYDDTDVPGYRGCSDQGLRGDGERVLAMTSQKRDQNIADRVVPANEKTLVGCTINTVKRLIMDIDQPFAGAQNRSIACADVRGRKRL